MKYIINIIIIILHIIIGDIIVEWHDGQKTTSTGATLLNVEN